jgi:hypothetical protein
MLDYMENNKERSQNSSKERGSKIASKLTVADPGFEHFSGWPLDIDTRQAVHPIRWT